jgi:hypothetical protein
VVNSKEGTEIDEVTLILSRVASRETQSIADKLQSLPNVRQVSIVTRAEDRITPG